MKKFIFMVVLASLFISPVLYLAYSQDQDVNVILKQLEGELLNLKIPVNDINSITPVLRNLLNQGATKGDLTNMIISVTKKGLTAKDLYSCLESASSLVESGAKVDEAVNVVSQGVDQGLAYGFKGGDLGLINKVQEAVEQKKMQLFEGGNKMSQERQAPDK